MSDRSGSISFVAATPQFSVPDLVRTTEYYRDVLGFEIAGYWDGERVDRVPRNPPLFAIVRRDEVEVFFKRGDGPPEAAYELYFRVKGVDALAEQLRARGADILDGPEERIYGQRELVVRDCNGVILTFAEQTQRTTPP